MSVSVVIVTCNSAEVVESALDSVVGDPLVRQCIVVDNASKDDTCARIGATYPSVELLRNDTNQGFGRACNRAMEQVRTRYCLLLNPDACLGEGALSRLHEVLEAQPKAAMAAPVLGGAGQHLAESLRAPECHDKAYPLCRRTTMEGVYSVAFISGAIALLRMDILRRVGFFDPAFFLFFEDDDLSLRLKKAGHDLLLVQHVQATHKVGQSTPATPEVQWLKGMSWQWSRLYLHRKHRGRIAAWREWYADYREWRRQSRKLKAEPDIDMSVVWEASCAAEVWLARCIREIEESLLTTFHRHERRAASCNRATGRRLWEADMRLRGQLWQDMHAVLLWLIEEVVSAHEEFFASASDTQDAALRRKIGKQRRRFHGIADSWREALQHEQERFRRLRDMQQERLHTASLHAEEAGQERERQISTYLEANRTISDMLVAAIPRQIEETEYGLHPAWKGIEARYHDLWELFYEERQACLKRSDEQWQQAWGEILQDEYVFWGGVFDWPNRLTSDEDGIRSQCLADCGSGSGSGLLHGLEGKLASIRHMAYGRLEALNTPVQKRLTRLHHVMQARKAHERHREELREDEAGRRAHARKDVLWKRHFDEMDGLWMAIRRRVADSRHMEARIAAMRLFRKNSRYCEW